METTKIISGKRNSVYELYAKIDRWIFGALPSRYARAAYMKANFLAFRKLRLLAPLEIETRHHFRMNVDKIDRVASYIYYFGVWEPQVSAIIERLLQPGDTVLDVGAHIGHHTLLASHTVGNEGHVYAFEAAPNTFTRLMANIELNDCRNVHVCHSAVCATTGSVTLFVGSREQSLRNSLTPGMSGHRGVEVAACRLDDLVDEIDCSRIKLIKIDVEGAEPQVLEGARGLFSVLPMDVAILLELRVDPDDHCISSGRGSLEYLKELGFTAFSINNDYAATTYDQPLRLTPVSVLHENSLMDVLLVRGQLVDEVATFVSVPN